MKKKKSKKYPTITIGDYAYGVKGGATLRNYALRNRRKKAKKGGK